MKSLVVARINDTGIHSNNSSSSLKVHPQQTSDFVCIENLSEDTCIKVLDMNGNTVFRTNVSDEQYVLNMTPFSQGMYLVVISAQGQSQSVKVLKY